ncbi:hypothetical protein sos41_17850 [Alphaproteobacteria bacterium SO-S41]|nr:hypothetical protein sos41_17850 [Alphaproteobacteria bacterium SO-S41]
MPPDDLRFAGRAKLWLQDRLNFAGATWTGRLDLDAVDSGLHDLAARQVDPWKASPFNRATLDETFDALNRAHANIFVFDIRSGAITVRPKGLVDETPLIAMQMPQFQARVRRYRALLQAALAAARLKLDLSLAIDVNDHPLGQSDVPVFAFQNTAQSNAILLPDIDFLNWNWYLRQTDRVPYDAKAIRAVFAGSSSGQLHDVEDILNPTNPRLIAAAHFVCHPHIDFRISEIVQCTDAAKALLERQPYFKPRLGWPEQWQNRFILSLDGNGATCSRVALGLKSNSALVKYASPFDLFYFPKLCAGADFLEVTGETEIETIVDRELSAPGHHRDIAEAGRRFYQLYLGRRPLIAYTALLLRAYHAAL